MAGSVVNLSSSLTFAARKISRFEFQWNSQFLLLATAFFFTTLLTAFVSFAPLERTARNISDAVNSKPASGQIHLVEIDAKSLQQLQKWPWPRNYHAQLVDRLTEAGAAQIVFDVDFSSRSEPEGDAAFAAALKRSEGKVVLPTFRQAASSGHSTEEIESLPLKSFREHAFLGSVNVHPDTNGQVNSYPYGMITDKTPRPSIASLLADKDGSLGSSFKIDQSIEIDSIAKHSFVDILNGDFDVNSVRNKKIIVGATAIEIGDRYPTSRFGVIPGVVIQTMAAETLLAGTDLPQLGPWPLLALALIMFAISVATCSQNRIASTIFTFAALVTLSLAPILAQRFKIAELDIMPAIVMVSIFLALRFVAGLFQTISTTKRLDIDTGLPNFTMWKNQKLEAGPKAVIVAEISNFKEITSTLDDTEIVYFVQNVANRLNVAIAGNQLFRIDREQFCWSFNTAAPDAVEEMLNAAAHLFNAPLVIGTRSLRATICFGAVIDSSVQSSALSGMAALASKKACAAGVRTIWHNEDMAENNSESVFILSEFATALASGHITVVYQPKYSIAANRVSGAEALVRWNHPVKGPISPSVFVPVLEHENLMEELTLFVLGEIAREMPRWNNGPLAFGCAVNVSATLLMNSDFAQKALKMIKASQIDMDLLTIELTESAALSSTEQAAKMLQKLKELGLRLSIDDYGTGQSTLSYLKEFNADEVKIDQSFVRTIKTDHINLIMVKSTIEMAQALGMSVVAEGVEDSSVFDMLADLGCDVIQGWYIGKPETGQQFFNNWVNPDQEERPQIQAA